ncbi:MAG: alginate export family protein, partial [Gammaproteobacteria bacterium]|nr:alginate export family protein [Gammaproteobacteria bacterium]
MKGKGTGISLTVLLAMALAAPQALAQEPDQENDIGAAIDAGDASVDLRYRFELVDQESFAKDASASTLRLRLNYKTGDWKQWSGFLEFDHVMEVFSTSFNSDAGTSSPRRSQYPVVADPKGPDLNQLYFQYVPSESLQARIGRQRILLDDQRFVGGVGWRQNEQTYDGVTFNYKGASKTNVFYSYISNVNRIFGSTVPAGDHRQDTHLLNASFGMVDNWNFVGYGYVIDNEDSPGFSTSTFGARATGTISSGDNQFDLLGELATQSDNANNPASYDAGYFRFQGTWSRDAFGAGIGFESLGSDNGQGFRTPLATLHAFNGWADQFLATPATGLEDFYIRGTYKVGAWSLQLIYHDYSAETGGEDYGTEIDFAAARKLGDRYNLLLKFAD